MGEVIAFRLAAWVSPVRREEPADVVVLPVVRVERPVEVRVRRRGRRSLLPPIQLPSWDEISK